MASGSLIRIRGARVGGLELLRGPQTLAVAARKHTGWSSIYRNESAKSFSIRIARGLHSMFEDCMLTASAVSNHVVGCLKPSVGLLTLFWRMFGFICWIVLSVIIYYVFYGLSHSCVLHNIYFVDLLAVLGDYGSI